MHSKADRPVKTALRHVEICCDTGGWLRAEGGENAWGACFKPREQNPILHPGAIGRAAPDRMGIRQRLKDVYSRVPLLKCRGLCQDTCGPVPAARDEIRLMEQSSGRAYGWQLRTGHCTFLDESTGRCSCYRDRPIVCRTWGTVTSSMCPFGCEPDQWLTPEQFDDLLARVKEIAGAYASPRPFTGDRPATEEEYQRTTQAADALIARGLRLPDAWDVSRPYVICPLCEWRGQSVEGIDPERFVGEPCPHCPTGVLRLAKPGDRPLFVPKVR